jgi:hypothetical protein
MRRVLILMVSIVCAACSSGPTAPTGVTVSSISPLSGTTLGGTVLTVVGMNFTAGATVTVGGVPATNVEVTSPRTISATTGQHASGPADVTVSLGGKTGTLPGAFTYISPSPTVNTPPVIVSITARGPRSNEPPNFADLNEELELTAVVQDAESAITLLTFAYTASAGTITGTGPAVRWRAPQSGTTPLTATITLTVTEKYSTVDASGLPTTKENIVTRTGTISVHNSVKEVAEMAQDFLIDFSRQLRPTDVLRNFRDQCPSATGGKSAELNDVTENQRDFLITQWNVDFARVTIAFGGQCTLFSTRFRPGDACANVATEWSSTLKRDTSAGPAGTKFHVTGIDQVSAAFVEGRWWLCESDFLGTGNITTTGAKVPSSVFIK